MLVVVVVHRRHSWVGLLAFLFWKLTWYLLVCWKLVLREEACRSAAAQGLWALCLKYIMSSVIVTYILPLDGNQGQSQSLILLGEFLGQPWQTTQKELLMTGIGALLDGQWLFEIALPTQMAGFNFNCIWIFMYWLTCIIDIFRESVNNMIFMTFPDCYPPPSSVFISLSPP